MSDSFTEKSPRSHVVSELGLGVELVGKELHGTAEISPHMHVPGTTDLRTSILAIWLDVLTGVQCIDVFGGRVPVTLDLALDLLRPAPGSGRVHAVARTVKVGRSVSVAEVGFRLAGADDCFALGTASFMAAPDTALTLPPQAQHLAGWGWRPPALSQPFAERVGTVQQEPGVVALKRSEDGLNSSNTINGGLLALLVEEAALSAAAPGATLSSMAIRYLRPARLGPVVGRAHAQGDVTRVEVRDEGADDRLAVLATTRVTAPR